MTTVDKPITRPEVEDIVGLAIKDLEVRILREMNTHLRWMIGLYLLGLGVIAAVVKLI